MIGGASDSHANSEVELPLRTEIHINGRKDLLLLLSQGQQAIDRPPRTVVFQPSSDAFAEVVAHFGIRREHHSLVYARSVPRAVERRIEGQIPAVDLLVDNRTDFPRPGVG